MNELANKTTKELVDIYNSIPGVKPAKRFSSKEVAVRRILKALSGSEATPVGLADGLSVRNVRTGEVQQPKKRGRKKKVPGIYNLSNEGRLHRNFRPSSGRGKLVALLQEGRTFTELLTELPQWNPDQLHKHIRCLNYWGGWALSTDEKGVIRATR